MSSHRPLLLATALVGALTLAGGALAQTPPAAAPAPATPAPATPPAQPQALPSVNGTPITEADLRAAEAELAEALQSIPEAQRREQLVDYIVTVRVLSAQARQERLQEGEDAQARLRFVADKYLMETLLRREIDRRVTPQAVEAFYRERVASQPPEAEVRARHILVAEEADARAIIAELGRGANFEELARQRSTDPGSKDEGGDLGFFTRERMVREFAEAAFALQPGQVTPNPVRSQFGWHVIKVEERRTQPVPALADLDGQIRNFLSRRVQGEVITQLRQGARIERR